MMPSNDNSDTRKTVSSPQPQRKSIGERLKSPLRVFFQLVLNFVFSNDPKKVGQVVLNGRSQFVWLREHVGRKIVLRIFERKETRFFLRYLQPGDICLDIGANVGYYTHLFASRVGATGRVIAVEPLHRNVLLIQLGAVINHTDDFTAVICAAVSDTDSDLAVSECGDSSYANIQTAGQDAGSRVEALTLDSLFRRFKLPRIDVVKMDIEGWEFRALQGMEGTLSNPAIRPRLMMIELYEDHLRKYDSSIRQICEYLARFDYQPKVLDKNGALIPFQPEHHNIIYNVFFLDKNAKS